MTCFAGANISSILNIYSETIMERFIQKINLKRQQSYKLNSTMNSVENNRTINRFSNLKINITTLPNEIIIKIFQYYIWIRNKYIREQYRQFQTHNQIFVHFNVYECRRRLKQTNSYSIETYFLFKIKLLKFLHRRGNHLKVIYNINIRLNCNYFYNLRISQR